MQLSCQVTPTFFFFGYLFVIRGEGGRGGGGSQLRYDGNDLPLPPSFFLFFFLFLLLLFFLRHINRLTS